MKDFLSLGAQLADTNPEISILMVRKVLDLLVLNNSMTTQYILSGGAVMVNLLAKVTYDHLGNHYLKFSFSSVPDQTQRGYSTIPTAARYFNRDSLC